MLRRNFVHGRLCTPLATVALAAALNAALAGPSDAQIGAFVNSSPPWIGPGGTVGVGIQSGQIWVDVNANGETNPGADSFHPIPPGLATGWMFSLSPSRRVMIAVTSSGAGCPGTAPTIRLYSIPVTSGADLVALSGPHVLARCIARTGFFDDPTKPVRTAFFFENPHPTTGLGNILWVDLVTGAASTSPIQFASGLGDVKFSPFGTMAWVQHRLSSPGGTDYSMVQLCPANLGLTSAPALTGQSGERNAFVEGAGPYTVAVRNVSNGLEASYTYFDCALPPPSTGACCLPGGGCLGGTTSGECTTLSGTWQGANSACAVPPCQPVPAAILSATLAAPDTSYRGTLLTYTFTVRNDGALSSNSVVLTAQIPNNTSFSSASGGGTYSGITVTWAIGTLMPGAVQQRTMTVLVSCFLTTVPSGNYSVSGTPGGTVPGSTSKTTQLISQPTTGLTVALQSQAQSPVPLQTGGRVRHTVTLTNTLAIPREGSKCTINAGSSSVIAQVIDAGGGTVSNFSSGMLWDGTIGALSSVAIVYETEIGHCRPDTATSEIINRGQTVRISNSCNTQIGSALPATSIAVAPSPLRARLTSPTHGPAHTWGTGSSRLILARPGATVDLALAVINSGTAVVPTVSMTLELPSGLAPVGNPPFVGATPTGTTWDAGLNTVTYVGSPSPNDSVVIMLRTQVDNGACGLDLEPVGDFANCFGILRHPLKIMVVPAPPAGPHLLGLYSSDGLWTWEPSQPASIVNTGCVGFENLRGFCRAPDGNIWVVGTPSFRLNPALLQFEILPQAFFNPMDMDFPSDVAVDPRDSSLVFSGYKSGFGLRMSRYRPVTHQVTPILSASISVGIGQKIAIAADGLIAAATGSGLLKIPPANPASFQQLTSPGVDGAECVAIDTDGHFLIGEADHTANGPQRVISVNRTSGVFTPSVNLYGAVGIWSPFEAIAVEPDGDVYAGFSSTGVMRVDRSAGNTLTAIPFGVPIADLEWVGGIATTAVGDPLITPDSEIAELSFAVAPNPFRSGTALRFVLPYDAPVEIAMFDVGGRRLRTLTRADWNAGEHSVRWDGRDDAGRPLGPGLYFARMSAAGEERVVRAVRVD